MYHMVSPCSDSESWSAEPKEEIEIDMIKIRDALKEQNYKILFDSEIILLVEHPTIGEELSVFPSGKLLYKTSDDEKVKSMHSDMLKIVKKIIKE